MTLVRPQMVNLELEDLAEMSNTYNSIPEYIVYLENIVNSLQKEADFLHCLDAVGVDNWDGYCDAQRLFNKEEEE